MNDLRRRQIEEVLDYDKNINTMVMNIERKNVGLTTESLLPYTQLNAEVNESVSTSINQLFVLLERKKSEVHTYLQHNYAIVGMKKASVQELGNIEEVMRLYNTAVEPYLGMKTSLTQTTKNQLLSSIRKIMPQVSYLVNKLRGALEILRNPPPGERVTANRINAEYPKLLRGFVTYMMILQQLNTGNVCPISRTDLNKELQFYIDNITDPNIQAVFNRGGLSLDRDF